MAISLEHWGFIQNRLKYSADKTKLDLSGIQNIESSDSTHINALINQNNIQSIDLRGATFVQGYSVYNFLSNGLEIGRNNKIKKIIIDVNTSGQEIKNINSLVGIDCELWIGDQLLHVLPGQDPAEAIQSLQQTQQISVQEEEQKQSQEGSSWGMKSMKNMLSTSVYSAKNQLAKWTGQQTDAERHDRLVLDIQNVNKILSSCGYSEYTLRENLSAGELNNEIERFEKFLVEQNIDLKELDEIEKQAQENFDLLERSLQSITTVTTEQPQEEVQTEVQEGQPQEEVIQQEQTYYQPPPQQNQIVYKNLQPYVPGKNDHQYPQQQIQKQVKKAEEQAEQQKFEMKCQEYSKKQKQFLDCIQKQKQTQELSIKINEKKVGTQKLEQEIREDNIKLCKERSDKAVEYYNTQKQLERVEQGLLKINLDVANSHSNFKIHNDNVLNHHSIIKYNYDIARNAEPTTQDLLKNYETQIKELGDALKRCEIMSSWITYKAELGRQAGIYEQQQPQIQQQQPQIQQQQYQPYIQINLNPKYPTLKEVIKDCYSKARLDAWSEQSNDDIPFLQKHLKEYNSDIIVSESDNGLVTILKKLNLEFQLMDQINKIYKIKYCPKEHQDLSLNDYEILHELLRAEGNLTESQYTHKSGYASNTEEEVNSNEEEKKQKTFKNTNEIDIFGDNKKHHDTSTQELKSNDDNSPDDVKDGPQELDATYHAEKALENQPALDDPHSQEIENKSEERAKSADEKAQEHAEEGLNGLCIAEKFDFTLKLDVSEEEQCNIYHLPEGADKEVSSPDAIDPIVYDTEHNETGSAPVVMVGGTYHWIELIA